MAPQKSKRGSRKARAARRTTAPAPQPTAPAPKQAGGATTKAAAPRVKPKVTPKAQAAAGTRRQQRDERERQTLANSKYATRSLGTYGPQPKSIFHPVPVSEVAILVGLVGVVIGFIDRGSPALWVGALVCGLAVFEFTARDHFSGYRSHTTLLAAFPAVVVEVIFAVAIGSPNKRIYLLAPVIPIFLLSFWGLRKIFQNARHRRVISMPKA